jgi:rRNA biogenesis protein RRP5
MKVFGQVIAVQPLALIVSLPNQLLAHVPVTNITSQLTAKLEALDEGADEDHDVEMENDLEDSLKESALLPDLVDMFQPGQYVRAVVTAVHTQGSTLGITGSRSRDETEKASRRVELSLIPGKINGTVAKADLKQGFVSSHCNF